MTYHFSKAKIWFCLVLLVMMICLVATNANAQAFDAIKERIDGMTDKHYVDLTHETLTLEEMAALKAMYGDTVFSWGLSIYGQTCSWEDTYFSMGETVITDYEELLLFLHVFPNLTHVDMYATKIERPEIDMLASTFPEITFGWSMRVAEHVIRTDAAAFSTLHGRKSSPHTSKDFEVLKYCQNLYALDLGHNVIDDLTFLSGLTDLKILILACNEISDITPLKTLDKLEYLELFVNQIRDISALAGMHHLAYLELSVNDIEDYSPLFGLSKLERLNVTRSGKKIAKDELKKALPECRIDTLVNPAQESWRKMARYIYVKKIFDSGVYKEWSMDKGK